MKEQLADVEHLYDLIVTILVTYSFQIAGAVVILIGGFVTAGWIARALLRLQERRNVDVTLRQFIANSVRLVVIGLFVIIALSKLGISMTPLIAAVGGLAVGASLAIQGPLSNYSAGLVIILTRMFKVGDTIAVQGCAGIVTDIELAATRLLTEDGEHVIIPNKHIVGEIHRNSYAWRLVEGRVTLDSTSDAEQAAIIIDQVIGATAPEPDRPAPAIGIEAFGDGVIVIGYRYWVPTARYFELLYSVNNAVHRDLRAAGLRLAGPRSQVLPPVPP